jgi:TATA-box binding protein (TBP) (component of TFIID and TFIIIB)
LINSDFDLGYQIDREKLHRDIVENDIYSSYEPCIYPGVNIKYFINTNNTCGICDCENMCNGKGSGCGDGQCKKVTIAVFKSGKVIITGGRNKEQINESYRFITNFIGSKKDIFCQKAVNREL